MTTLPQTTNLRLPRPAGGAPPALAGGASASHAPIGGMSAADVWRVIRANTVLITSLVVISIVLGFAINSYLLRYHSRYTAIGMIAVDPRTSFNPLAKADEGYTDYGGLQIEQRTQAAILTSESLLANVLSDPSSPIRTTKWGQQFAVNDKGGSGTEDRFDIASARAALSQSFFATPIADSKLIKVDMSCSDKEDCRTIMEAIVNKHLDEQRSIASQRVVDQGTTLHNLEFKLQNHLKELTDRRNDLIVKTGYTGLNTNGRYTPTDIELQSIVQKQIELTTSAASAKQQYETLQQQIQNGIDPPSVDDIADRDPTVIDYKSKVVALDVEIKAELSLGKDAQSIKENQIRRDAYEAEYEKERDSKRIATRNLLISNAQMAADSAQQQVEVAAKKIESLKETSGAMSLAMSDYLGYLDQITSVNDQLKDVREHLDALSSSNSASQVDWARKPETPDSPSFPKLGITMTMALFLGLGTALGIAFLREIMDTSVRSPRDIARVGQMNLLGMIPHEDDDPQSAGVPLPMVIFQAPTSIMAEQYRQVRTRLQHAASLDTTRSIMVTSPAPGDGKTIVACNLASGLALNGRKILLVDANFRRPELNKAFNVPNDVGFSNALASLDNFEGAIRSTQVPNLDVMTTGLKPANPAELMESQLFTDFIDRALEEYDHVIFDTGPMLLVSETTAMAPRVDGVVTVVRAASNSRGLLQRLRDALRQVKAEHLGIILNGVRAQGGGYYGRNIKTYYEYQNGHAA